MRTSRAGAGLLALAAWSCLGISSPVCGEPQRPGDPPLIRVSVNLVQIDVVARDRKGKQVADLKPEELEIRQDGKLQNITHFSYLPSGADRQGARARDAQEKMLLPQRSRELRREDVRRTIALIVDDITMQIEDVYSARQALLTCVQNQIGEGDLLAVATTSGGTGLLTRFSNDRRQLLAATKEVRFKLGNFSFFCGSDPG